MTIKEAKRIAIRSGYRIKESEYRTIQCSVAVDESTIMDDSFPPSYFLTEDKIGNALCNILDWQPNFTFDGLEEEYQASIHVEVSEADIRDLERKASYTDDIGDGLRITEVDGQTDDAVSLGFTFQYDIEPSLNEAKRIVRKAGYSII
jgi:hypothetical protein